ncbi:MAG: hypothetical protein HPY69_12325 [Armatimonadetes bacterium]|nr:hypothetical protein [Armatimonadota bacterium]
MAYWWRASILVALVGLPAAAQELADPRQDPYFSNPTLRGLMDWVTLRFTFDAGNLLPDMAAGDFAPQWGKAPQFRPGVRGQALLAGDGSAAELFARGPNATLGSRGAISLWVCPLDWKHDNGGNTTLVMSSNATFYLQRQGPMQNTDGSWARLEGLQFLMLVPEKGPGTLMVGTGDWPNGRWRFVVANWSWPVMQLSLDGGEFAVFTVKTAPADADFGGLLIGADGGDPTLMDELCFYRRPLSLAEVRLLYETLKPKEAVP